MREKLRYLMFLVGTYYFLQGVTGNPGLHEQALKRHLKEVLHFAPSEAAAFLAFITIPWMIKPLYGIISDAFPILGYRRKSYFVFSGMLATLSFGWLAYVGVEKNLLWFMLFSAGVGVAFSDVLCDAIMVEKGQPIGATGRLQSIQWALGPAGFAGIIVAFSKGYIAEFIPLATALYFPFTLSLILVVFTLFFLKEEKVGTPKEAVTSVRLGLKSAVRSKPLWATVFFLFLFQLNPNLGSVFYYYEKDVLRFSDIFIGQIDTVAGFAFLVGAALFGLLEKRVPYKTLLKIVIVTGVLGNIAYLFFRGVVSAFIVTAFAGVVGATALLGILTVAARACPKRVEGTVFALLMSVYNIGTQLGSWTGAKLYESIGYFWLVVIAAAFTALMWFFLPLVKNVGNETAADKNSVSATSG